MQSFALVHLPRHQSCSDCYMFQNDAAADTLGVDEIGRWLLTENYELRAPDGSVRVLMNDLTVISLEIHSSAVDSIEETSWSADWT